MFWRHYRHSNLLWKMTSAITIRWVNLKQYFSDFETEDVDPAYESSNWYKKQESSKPADIALPAALHTGLHFHNNCYSNTLLCKCSYSSVQCCHYSETSGQELKRLYCQPLSCKVTCQTGACHESGKPHWSKIHSYLCDKGGPKYYSEAVNWLNCKRCRQYKDVNCTLLNHL